MPGKSSPMYTPTLIITIYCELRCSKYHPLQYLTVPRYYIKQYSGSGAGSVCFWTSWIRILPSTCKKFKKNIDFCCSVTSQ
jgi:hypothetical protein